MIRFEEFVYETSGFNPYPWQSEFARRCAEGNPPSAAAVPTGAGKTAVLHALIWALAKQADRPAVERTVGVRTIWAIDRRILVDDVYEQVEKIGDRLYKTLEDIVEDDSLFGMARALLSIAAGKPMDDDGAVHDALERGLRPLIATRWRGGIARSSSLPVPIQPEVITSTVAQLGSRLLFRGYGVSSRTQPVMAGLCAVDSNLCIDEAHLAEPLLQTIDAVIARRAMEQDHLKTPPVNRIVVSATAPEGDLAPDVVVRLSDSDRQQLDDRFNGKKTATLREADKPVKALIEAVNDLLNEGHVEIACVVNRVSLARDVFNKLRDVRSKERKLDAKLLIGPQRPDDRNAVVDDLFKRLGAGRTSAFDAPVVVVATQTVEVGLDLSFTGMVTQSASASSLVQRFGRLNRFGGERPGEAIVVRDPGSWVYGGDEPKCWDWLNARADVDGRIDISVAALTDDQTRPVSMHRPEAPILTDAVVSQLMQTNPKPAPMAEPDIEPFLRGIGVETNADVQLIWRCDLRLTEAPGTSGFGYRTELLKAVPPQREEMLTLSVSAAKQLLARRLVKSGRDRDIDDEVDLEGVNRERRFSFTALKSAGPHLTVVRGGDVFDIDCRVGEIEFAHPDVRRLSEVRPGDTLVLPTSIGGADEFGLNPSSARTTDLSVKPGESDRKSSQGGPVRINVDVLRELAEAKRDDDESVTRDQSSDVVVNLFGALDDQFKNVDAGVLTPVDQRTIAEAADRITSGLGIGVTTALGLPVAPSHTGDVWRVSFLKSKEDDEDASEDLLSELSVRDPGATLVFVSRPIEGTSQRRNNESVMLLDHCEAVAGRADEFSNAIGLSSGQQRSLQLAGLAHDAGKADPRVQAWLSGGTASVGMRLLAKSAYGVEDRGASLRAKKIAGVPAGYRHEHGSVAVLRDLVDRADDSFDAGSDDGRLASHLVGTHHGFGRPVPPVADGSSSAPYEVEVDGQKGWATGGTSDGWHDGDWLSQFFDLSHRYGPWTLAYLEALLVLADRTISAEGK